MLKRLQFKVRFLTRVGFLSMRAYPFDRSGPMLRILLSSRDLSWKGGAQW